MTRTRRAGFLLLLLSGVCAGQSLRALSEAYQAKPSAASRAALARFAAAQAGNQQGALAQLALAYADLEANRPESAAAAAAKARQTLPQLADYALLLEAQALRKLSPATAAERALQAVARPGLSPVDGQALQTAAWALLESGDAESAVRALQPNLALLSAPSGLALLARSLHAANQLGAAALQYQRVYFDYPLSAEAADAAVALARLREQLGGGYPPALAQDILARSRKLISGGAGTRAIAELAQAAGGLGGPEADAARVLIGVARYFLNQNQAAVDYLRGLRVATGEADAERLYYLAQGLRRLEKFDGGLAIVEQLRSQYPRSEYTLRALVSLADAHLVRNEPERYVPLYASCAGMFPKEVRGGYCHWKLAWNEYLTQRGRAAARLEEHIEKFPRSNKVPAALYFLGRLREERGDAAVARAYYEAIAARFPGSYYNVQAQRRLTAAPVKQVRPAPATVQYLRLLASDAPKPDFAPDAATRARMGRAGLLARAGLSAWADGELRFGAKTDAKGAALAQALAEMASQRGDHAVAVRGIKALAPEYLSWDLKEAPAGFWKLAFPMPYRATLEKHGAERSIDPNLLAALIRQESEFDPKAVSRAKAVGLTQILPGTGRELSRKLKLGPYRSSMLTTPDTNVRMGAYYLSWLLSSLDGRYDAALAAYNAGKTRAVRWLDWFGHGLEQAEFIECIPFTETRDYIQIVLRNADIYRRLYGGEPVAASAGAGSRMLDSSSGAHTTGGNAAANRHAGGRQAAGAVPFP